MTEPQALEERVRQLERALADYSARAEIRGKREARIEEKLDLLIAESHERKGREAAALAAVEQRTDDRQERNAWLRHFFPVGLLVGIWSAILWIVEWLGVSNGGP